MPLSLSAEADGADTSPLGLHLGLPFVPAAHLLSRGFVSQRPAPLHAYKSLTSAGPRSGMFSGPIAVSLRLREGVGSEL